MAIGAYAFVSYVAQHLAFRFKRKFKPFRLQLLLLTQALTATKLLRRRPAKHASELHITASSTSIQLQHTRHRPPPRLRLRLAPCAERWRHVKSSVTSGVSEARLQQHNHVRQGFHMFLAPNSDPSRVLDSVYPQSQRIPPQAGQARPSVKTV